MISAFDLVEASRAEELPPALVRSVDVRRVVEREGILTLTAPLAEHHSGFPR